MVKGKETNTSVEGSFSTRPGARYIASFFLGNGGKLGLDENGNQTCDFNNAAGLATAEAIKAFAKPTYPTVKDGGEMQNVTGQSNSQRFADWFAQNANIH